MQQGKNVNLKDENDSAAAAVVNMDHFFYPRRCYYIVNKVRVFVIVTEKWLI